jgi:hypothetical protein
MRQSGIEREREREREREKRGGSSCDTVTLAAGVLFRYASDSLTQ